MTYVSRPLAPSGSSRCLSTPSPVSQSRTAVLRASDRVGWAQGDVGGISQELQLLLGTASRHYKMHQREKEAAVGSKAPLFVGPGARGGLIHKIVLKGI